MFSWHQMPTLSWLSLAYVSCCCGNNSPYFCPYCVPVARTLDRRLCFIVSSALRFAFKCSSTTIFFFFFFFFF
ncbi:hypothetical protein F5Y09DRAFT_307189, partial [Xylaria sp. FL1042]